MKKLTAILCLTLSVLLGSAGGGWDADYQKGLGVEVTIATHDAGSVMEKDIDLAIFMDELASS